MKVLLVEDEKILREMCVKHLKKNKVSVLEAIEGEEAIQKAKEELPDVILLDIIIPSKDGYEVLKEIKSDSQAKNIPVIMLSNLGQQEEVDKAKKMGADDFIIKANTMPKEIAEYVLKNFAKD
jgi:two-component system alkaline phosphatase synthesis response regulator PhoP